MNAALRQTLSPARKPCGSLRVQIAGETCVLRCSGALWLPAHRALIAADLHLEKGSAFAARGQMLPPYDSRATLDRLETNPRFAAIARPANAAILIKLRIDMEDRGGRIELLLPYATLEPIRKMLLQQFMGEKFGRDNIWEGHLATEIWTTETEVRAVLDEQVMPLSSVLNLKVGDTMMLNATPDSEVSIRAGAIPLTTGRMGRKGQHIAVRIEGPVNPEIAARIRGPR